MCQSQQLEGAFIQGNVPVGISMGISYTVRYVLICTSQGPLGFPSRSAVNWKGLLKKAFLLRFYFFFYRAISTLRNWISLFRVSVLISFRTGLSSSLASCHLFLSIFSFPCNSLICHCLLTECVLWCQPSERINGY